MKEVISAEDARKIGEKLSVTGTKEADIYLQLATVMEINAQMLVLLQEITNTPTGICSPSDGWPVAARRVVAIARAFDKRLKETEAKLQK